MKSMTGMGKARGIVQGASVRLEIKTVNHRFCEISLRAPGRYSVLEIPTQQVIRELINRGRVEINIFEEKTPTLSQAEIEAYTNYHAFLNEVSKTLQLTSEIKLEHLLPGVGGWINRELEGNAAWDEFKPILESAVTDLNKMRLEEGSVLKKDMTDRFLTIEKIKSNIESLTAHVQQDLEERLNKKIEDRISEIKEIDPNRLHSEVVYYLDRMDISEELKRLDSHLSQMQTFLACETPIGRKIDFLIQEFNREFNTIASKAQNADISHLVVDAKVELEKVREQVQNIE